jgi:cyclase
MKKGIYFWLAIGFLCVSSSAYLNAFDDYDYEIVLLKKGVHRLTIDFSLRPNLAVSTGGDGVLIVDTGFEQTAEKLKSIISDLDSGDLRYIINTHDHGDHQGANSLVKGPNTLIVGSNRLEFMTNSGGLKRGTDLKTRSGKKFAPAYILNFNGEPIHLIPYPGLHDETDMLIHFTKSRVAHLGDLLLTQSFPSVGSRVPGYLEFLDIIMDYFPENTIFIGGHGREYAQSDIKIYKNMLLKTIAIVRDAMTTGKTTEQMIEENLLGEYESWGEYLTFLGPDAWIKMVTASYRKN